jgi:hypothetical protein
LEKEVIELAGASTSVIRDFTKVVTDDAPRYSFFVFKRELLRGNIVSYVLKLVLQTPMKERSRPH